jgi:hypothetical protein
MRREISDLKRELVEAHAEKIAMVDNASASQEMMDTTQTMNYESS